MDILEAIQCRHSVRSYTDQAIEAEKREMLEQVINVCNQASGLHIQICYDEPEAFSGMLAHYGKFSNVRNYIILAGKKKPDQSENIGYYGEKIVLEATRLGLSTCWVALTYSKRKIQGQILPDEKVYCVISIGYGTTQGTVHTNKPLDAVCTSSQPMPHWFQEAMRYVQMAPTAMNQQKYKFILEGNTVQAMTSGGPYTKVDLGIAKYHFEQGAQGNNWIWK